MLGFFKRKPSKPQLQPHTAVAVAFGTPGKPTMVVSFESSELPYIKHHALRALCGLLMDRHSDCQVCPFCGDSDAMIQVIVRVEGQVDAVSKAPVVALYFCKATEVVGDNMDPVRDWAFRVGYAESTPFRKAVVNLLGDGSYFAEYGPIANPTEGDYSTGQLDRTAPTYSFRCVPEPTHTQWHYWESELTANQRTVPEFLCLRLRGEWWVIDRDIEESGVQQVAALTVADNPAHERRTPV